MIYGFYIFGRGRKCICRDEWNRARPCKDTALETKFLGGVLLTLKSFAQQIGPPGTQGFLSYVTPQYKLHSFETASGYTFVLTTDPTAPDQQESLRHIYAELFVEHVTKNPMYRIGDDVSERCGSFQAKLQEFVQTRPAFATIAA